MKKKKTIKFLGLECDASNFITINKKDLGDDIQDGNLIVRDNKMKKKKELLKKLYDLHLEANSMESGRDQQDYHMDADNLLLEYIDDEQITMAFRDIPKWYA